LNDDGTIQIRSYRVCFDLERRIHKIDRWRVPLPYGVPVRGLAYFVVVLLAVLAAAQLPITGAVIGALHPAVRLFVLPVGAAAVLTRWSLDGRSAHQVALAAVRMQTEPSRVAAFRPARPGGRAELGELVLAHDERSARLRRARVEGPARVTLRYPISARPRGRTLRVAQAGEDALWRGKQVDLRAGQRMVVR
jgi:hypothetical protein